MVVTYFFGFDCMTEVDSWQNIVFLLAAFIWLLFIKLWFDAVDLACVTGRSTVSMLIMAINLDLSASIFLLLFLLFFF